MKQHLGGKTAIGDHIGSVQKVFKGIFNMESSFKQDGSQFDHLFVDGEITGRFSSAKAEHWVREFIAEHLDIE